MNEKNNFRTNDVAEKWNRPQVKISMVMEVSKYREQGWLKLIIQKKMVAMGTAQHKQVL